MRYAYALPGCRHTVELRHGGLVVHMPVTDDLRSGEGRVTVGMLVEEHHGGVAHDARPTVGVVRAISLVHCRYETRPGTKTQEAVPASARLTPVDRSARWPEEDETSGLSVCSWS